MRAPALEAEAAEAQSLFEARARGVQRELDERATTVGRRSAATSTCAPRSRPSGAGCSSAGSAEVEDRLARDPERRAEAERHRVALEQRGARRTASVERAPRRARRAASTRCSSGGARARRVEAERGRGAGGQLEEIRRARADGRAGAGRDPRAPAAARGRRRRDPLRLETAVERLRTDFDVEPAVALDAPAPEVPDGTTLAGRARELERELRLMGPINPLALEEYDALQERHEFLQEQLEDVKASRRELNRVDPGRRPGDRHASSAARSPTCSRELHRPLRHAVPGRRGRLLLTDPDDLLNTGIEMEARPSGKNVRRLSLLSGGERSLTALAFLFAVFRARPSPFYLMDEVEAALDDVNLHRFLDLVHEFRNEAQLLIVSHQKRTMEAADCLYGVSMPPGGSSRVVSQRIRDDLPVA